jgi:catecholate siderophore receptor
VIAVAALAAATPSAAATRPAAGDQQPDAGAMATADPAAAGPQRRDRFRFAIPAGTLGEALDAFARITGVQIRVDTDALATLPSPAVSGLLTADDALQALVAGTGTGYVWSGPDTVTLRLEQAEAVTVTAPAPALRSPKYTQPLRDTPQTITIIPREIIDQQGSTSLRDTLRNAPGITLMAGEGGAAPGDNLLIRGFAARNDVYVDGARDSGVLSRDTFNTESVEVVKGPSSAVTGRGAVGGSVNLSTKRAGLDDAASFQAIGGTAESARVTADVNRHLGAHAGLRLNAMWQDAGVARRDAVRDRAWGAASSLAFGLGTPSELTLGYQHLQQDNIPDYGLPGTLPAAAADQGITVRDLDFRNFYGLTSRDREEVTSDSGTVVASHAFGPSVSLRTLARYGRHDLRRVVTPPRAATPAASADDPGFDPDAAQMRRTDTKYQFRTDRAFTSQTDLTWRTETGRLRHAIVGGVEVGREWQPSYGVTDAFTHGRPPVTDFFHPQPEQAYVPALVRTGASSDGRSRSAGAYLFDTIQPGDRWQVDLGMRWDRIAVDYRTVEASGETAEYRRVDAAPSGRAAVVFKPRPEGSLYALYSTSFNPSFDGGFGLTLADRRGSLADLPPEHTRNLEAGVKWDLRPSLAVAAAVFHTEKTNAKTTDEAGATVLAGDQRVQGIELTLSGRLTSRWSVFGGMAVMDGKVRESGNPDEIGRQLSYVPRVSGTLWSAFQVPGVRLTIGAGAQYTDGYFFTNTNAVTSANAAAMRDLTQYWLFDAMARYDLSPRVSLQINGTNLANARYIDRGYSGHFVPGPGRALRIGPTFRF